MPTPNSSIPSSAATNKQNCMSAEALLEEQQKSIDYLRKKVELLEGRISELESQIRVTQTVTVFSKRKSTTKSNICGDRALLSTD